VARALEHHELALGGLRERHAAGGSGDGVLGSLDYEHRTADTAGQLAHGVGAEDLGDLGGDQRLGVRLEAPSHAVLDRLRGMRLREHL
jgi:hypothetical protein